MLVNQINIKKPQIYFKFLKKKKKVRKLEVAILVLLGVFQEKEKREIEK